MHCSFNSKYNSLTGKTILSFFLFKDDINTLKNIVFERFCQKDDIKQIHKLFLKYMIDKAHSKYDKLTFILPKVDKNNNFIGMNHINQNYIMEILKSPEVDAHNKKMVIKKYEHIEYMYKDFMPSLFFSINNFSKELMSINNLENKKSVVYTYDNIKHHYIDFKLIEKSPDFFDKYITIFTDAAFDNNNNAYGWAGWTKYKGQTYKNSGYGFTKDNNHSEMFAILYSLENLIEKHNKKEIDLNNKVISLTTDSDKCISIINKFNNNERYTKLLSELKGKIIQYSIQYNFELKLKGIKSHLSNSTNNKQAVNNWCDEEAKCQLNILRKKIATDGVFYVKTSKEEYTDQSNPTISKEKKRRKRQYLKRK